MDTMSGIHLRGICSNYFENHVSPVLKYIQQSQERLDKRMDDVAQKLQTVNESLEQKPNRDEVPSSSDLEIALSKSAHGNGMSVPVLSRLQDLSTMVQKKADASEISRLSALVEQKATVSQKKSDVAANLNLENLSTLVEQKIDFIREPLLKQIGEVSTRVEALVANLENKAETKNLPSLEQWQRLEKDVQASTSSMKRIEEIAVEVKTLAVALGNKAESKDVPTLEQWKRIEKDVQTSSSSTSNTAGEKSELKKVQMLVAAAGARFDKQLKELRQQVRELRECTPPTPRARNDGSLEDPRWPGRVIQSSTDDDLESEIGRRPTSHCGSIPDSLTGSVTGLGPEERAELQKIQAVVGAAGTAFSKEIRELKKQFNVLKDELIGLKERIAGA